MHALPLHGFVRWCCCAVLIHANISLLCLLCHRYLVWSLALHQQEGPRSAEAAGRLARIADVQAHLIAAEQPSPLDEIVSKHSDVSVSPSPIENYLGAAAIYESVFGEQSYAYTDSLRRLALCCQRFKDFKHARVYFECCLTIDSEVCERGEVVDYEFHDLVGHSRLLQCMARLAVEVSSHDSRQSQGDAGNSSALPELLAVAERYWAESVRWQCYGRVKAALYYASEGFQFAKAHKLTANARKLLERMAQLFRLPGEFFCPHHAAFLSLQAGLNRPHRDQEAMSNAGSPPPYAGSTISSVDLLEVWVPSGMRLPQRPLQRGHTRFDLKFVRGTPAARAQKDHLLSYPVLPPPHPLHQKLEDLRVRALELDFAYHNAFITSPQGVLALGPDHDNLVADLLMDMHSLMDCTWNASLNRASRPPRTAIDCGHEQVFVSYDSDEERAEEQCLRIPLPTAQCFANLHVMPQYHSLSDAMVQLGALEFQGPGRYVKVDPQPDVNELEKQLQQTNFSVFLPKLKLQTQSWTANGIKRHNLRRPSADDWAKWLKRAFPQVPTGLPSPQSILDQVVLDLSQRREHFNAVRFHVCLVRVAWD